MMDLALAKVGSFDTCTGKIFADSTMPPASSQAALGFLAGHANSNSCVFRAKFNTAIPGYYSVNFEGQRK